MTDTEPAHRKASAGNGNTGHTADRLDPVVLARVARIFRVGLARADARRAAEIAAREAA